MDKLYVTKIPNLNIIVVKRLNSKHFVTTKDSFIISIPSLAGLIKYLVKNDFMSIKVLEGILSELKE